MYCRACGYNLRALVSGQCPECGRPFDPANPKSYNLVRGRSRVRARIRRSAVVLGALAAGMFLLLLIAHVWHQRETHAIELLRSRGASVATEPADPEWLWLAIGVKHESARDLYADGVLADGDLALVARCRSLSALQLRRTAISVESSRRIARLPLWSVELSDCSLTAAHLKPFADNSHVLVMLLDNQDLGDDVVARLATIPNLISVSLAGTAVTDEACRELARLTNLTRLDLSRTAIGDVGCKSLAQLPNLERLDLAHTKVTDDGIAYLAASPRLRHVSLEGTAVTERGRFLVANSIEAGSATRLGKP